MDELKQYGKSAVAIYTLLAKNSLAMLGENYVYDSHTAFIKECPEFKTQFNVPVKQVFKAIFDEIAEDPEEKDKSTERSLGTTADLFIDEGANQKPANPTQKWLRGRLEKFNVGTGATRLSTISEISDGKNALLKDTKGVFSETQTGTIAWVFLENSWIGSVKTTERLNELMKQVGEGKVAEQYVISTATKLIKHDKDIFLKNEKQIKRIVGKPTKANQAREIKEKASDIWKGQRVSFSCEWSGIRFSDEQVEHLLQGKEISVKTKKNGRIYTTCGSLDQKKYKRKKFIGFHPSKFCS